MHQQLNYLSNVYLFEKPVQVIYDPIYVNDIIMVIYYLDAF
jgi:hypothetical protein